MSDISTALRILQACSSGSTRLRQGVTQTLSQQTSTIAADFAASPEAKSLYPFLTTPDVSSPTSFITAVYANLFNRAPDAAGQAFWEAQLSSGAVSPADAIDAIIKGATTAPDSTKK
mmetsp:Transcript_22252/g.34262  ORF Transcript_22252/g.34262 Transcript_22252/m.34262 type:complete len:117 (-) Transcript_22252:11-361(-)